MLTQLDALLIVEFQDENLSRKDWLGGPGQSLQGPWRWIDANHRYNSLLWDEEDRARRVDVGPTEIAASKRLIDRHNQLRNDAVEAIDEAILAQLAPVAHDDSARLSSETAGAMVDRLSILALKIFHMREQTRRSDADAAHIDACAAKLKRLQTQRHDLACCLDQLLREARLGRAYFKIYRQFKMYNDPSLNPYLYADKALAGAGKATP